MNDNERQEAAEREKAAVDRKYQRQEMLASIDDGKRRRGEMKHLRKLANLTHEALCDYDLYPNPPAVASYTEQAFCAFIERAQELIAAEQPSPTPPSDD